MNTRWLRQGFQPNDWTESKKANPFESVRLAFKLPKWVSSHFLKIENIYVKKYAGECIFWEKISRDINESQFATSISQESVLQDFPTAFATSSSSVILSKHMYF